MTALCLFMIPVMGLGAAPIEADGGPEKARKELVVRRVALDGEEPSFAAIAKTLDRAQVSFHPITHSWDAYPYRPEVKFRIAYDNSALYLQYQVREQYLLARCDLDDDACWPANDSCVEFFVSPGSNLHYANFEFSCIGYCLIESGEKGAERERLPLETTRQVRRESTLGNQTFEHREGDFSWTITIAIPLSLLIASDGATLSGTTWKANFYKCGDDLKEKAYLTWSPVYVPAPAFHHPDEFGTIVFE